MSKVSDAAFSEIVDQDGLQWEGLVDRGPVVRSVNATAIEADAGIDEQLEVRQTFHDHPDEVDNRERVGGPRGRDPQIKMTAERWESVSSLRDTDGRSRPT